MNAEKFVVAKAFNLVNRRLQVGEIVTEADISMHDTQMPFAERRKNGFLAGYDTKAADKAALKAKEADAPLIADAPEPAGPPTEEPLVPEPEPPAEPEIKRPKRG